jgi:hypothetical protein
MRKDADNFIIKSFDIYQLEIIMKNADKSKKSNMEGYGRKIEQAAGPGDKSANYLLGEYT